MAINFPGTPGNGSQHTASGITWTYDGTTWKADGITSSYTLPTASSTVLGGVKVGSGLSISSGTLSMTGVQYTDTTALNAVSTSTHHGLFALLNSDGHGYFARGGTVNVAVQVGVDNVNGQATGVFYFDGVEKPEFYPINRGVTFIFDQSDTTNATYNSQAHPLMFSTGSDGDHNGNGHYMTGVQYKLDGVNKTMAEYVSGFAAATTRTAEFTVAANAPDTLYYWCHSHTGQGNSIQVNQGPWVQLLDKSSSIGELRNVDTTAPTNGQVLKWVSASNHWAPANETGGSSYANSDVDAHLNVSGASSGQILSWNGSDYAWVADQTGGGGGSLTVADESVDLATAATKLNFVGDGITASGIGATKTITVTRAQNPIVTWTLTQSNNSTYGFSGDGFPTTQNNPTLTLMRGQTYKFVINAAGSHPTRIQSTGAQAGGGTPYNDGVTNQDANNGQTLTFVVPMNAPDTLYYQCTAHPAMFGTINILSQGGGGGGSGLQSRQSFNQATNSIADGATDNITITAYKTYSLLSIQTSAAAWVTLYTDQASRTADAGRNETTDPIPGSGVIAEVITTAAQTQIITPATIGWNNEATPVAAVYAKVVNKSGGTAAITVTITAVQLEG